MNFRYTIYNRVSGLYMKNECVRVLLRENYDLPVNL